MRVLLIDGTNVIIRYAHALLPVEMSSREPVNPQTGKVEKSGDE